MEREIPPNPQHPYELTLPPLDYIMDMQAQKETSRKATELAALENELALLEAKTADLRQQIETGGTSTPVKEFDTDYAIATAEHQRKAKRSTFEVLEDLHLPEGETLQTSYTVFHDNEMGGGYDEVRDISLSYSDGAYYASECVAYKHVSGGSYRSHLKPRSKMYVIAEKLEQPLVARDTAHFSAANFETVPWSNVRLEVSQITEALAKNALIERSLALLGSRNDPEVLQTDTLYSSSFLREFPISPGNTIYISAKYDKGNAKTDPQRLFTISVSLRVGDRIHEVYTIDARQFEIQTRDNSYVRTTQKQLCAKANALLHTITTA